MENRKMIKWNTFTARRCIEAVCNSRYTETEIISAWQYMIDKGICDKLQGWYERSANYLIDTGLCVKRKR